MNSRQVSPLIDVEGASITQLERVRAPAPLQMCRFCDGTGQRHPENNGSQFCCYDCKRHCGSFMVKDAVWRTAWPEYAAKKRALRQKYDGTPEYFRASLQLCLHCLQKRLGRKLVPDDFDLTVPLNDLIVLGMEMGAALAAEALRTKTG